MEIGIVHPVNTDRRDLAARVSEAAKMARLITGLTREEFGEASGEHYAATLGSEKLGDICAAVEEGRLIPSAIGLLVLAETAGVPIGVLFGDPATGVLIKRLTRKLEHLEALVLDRSR